MKAFYRDGFIRKVALTTRTVGPKGPEKTIQNEVRRVQPERLDASHYVFQLRDSLIVGS